MNGPLAVGLGPIGAGEFLADTEGAIGDPEGVGSEGRTVVGDHALNGDGQRSEVLDGGLHEAHDAFLAFIRVHLSKGDSAVLINGDEQEFPADVAAALGSVTGDPMAEPTEPLDVDVQQLSRRLALVVMDRFLALDSPARRSTRLTVALETPMYAAMRA